MPGNEAGLCRQRRRDDDGSSGWLSRKVAEGKQETKRERERESSNSVGERASD